MKNRSRFSLRFKIITGFSMIMVPLVLFLYFNNVYAMDVVRDQVSLTNRNYVIKNVEENERILKETNRYLYSLGEQDPDIISLFFLEYGSGDYTIAKQRIVNKFRTDLGFYDLLDGLFLYDTLHHDTVLATQNGYDEKITAIGEMMPEASRMSVGIPTYKWEIVQIKDNYHLVKTVRINEQFIAGAWVPMESLNQRVHSTEWGEGGGSVILSNQGTPLSSTEMPDEVVSLASEHKSALTSLYQVVGQGGDKDRYLMIGVPAHEAFINYVVMLPESSIMRNLPVFQRIIQLLPLAASILLILVLFFLRQVLFKPMNTLIRGMKKVSRGELNVKLAPSSSPEFTFVTETFNQMTTEVQDLKISMYEEQLRVQEAELKQLQMQINPHFYLNSLHIIHSLAALHKYDLVQKMAEHLGGYFRFSMQADRNVIPIKDELKHVENYLEIQTLRFPHLLKYHLELDPRCEDLLLPPLTLQPFVENSVLYGFKKGRGTLVITIGVTYLPEEEKLLIRIQDNGPGFSEDVLARLQDGEYTPEEKMGRSIGIWNVQHRLRKMKDKRAELHFENGSDGGAAVQITMNYKCHIPGEEITDVQLAHRG
ncbi:histidine kinase [Paenibacillus sp. Marseille-Q4541]|uniref:histidine kinase n=1 Tax=Paenibacillus sp. Marseille-Q4541 TaxID=2831522 RepID=UPI001BACDA86|nr:histidine kinase [Paenibacillus sp. Marseille-Q4541]